MDFYMKLPRNKKEFILFMAVISIISVNIIAPVITCFEFNFSLAPYQNVLRSIPFVWLGVIAVVLITYLPAEWMTNKIISKDDSYNSHIVINILCTVFLMSIILTVLATWIATHNISMDPIYGFFYKWPRNFAISLGVEMLIAQPIARFIMLKFHQLTDKKD